MAEFSTDGATRNLTTGTFWFERVHSTLAIDALDLGKISEDPGAQTFRLFSLFRDGDNRLNEITGPAGAAWSVTAPTSFPVTLSEGDGVVVTLELDSQKVTNVEQGQILIDLERDAHLEEFSYQVRRLYDPQPLAPLTERLEFVTDVQTALDGSEVRIAARRVPRQSMVATYALDENYDRARIENLMTSWQGRVFSLPIWTEMTRLSAPVTRAQAGVEVVSTDYADYRVGDQVFITDGTNQEIMTLASMTSTTLTFTADLTNLYGLNTCVMPVRDAIITEDISGARYTLGQQELQITWQILDPGSDLSDTSQWSSLDGLVLFDDCNVLTGTTLTERYSIRRTLFDPVQGAQTQRQVSPFNVRRSRKGFRAVGKQGVWKVRQLLHALRGRQKAVWLPTFCEDLTVTTDIEQDERTMTVTDVDFSKYVDGHPGRSVIRIRHAGGTEYATVIGGSSNGDGTETLTLADTWSTDITAANITRVDLVEKVRLASDVVNIQHQPGGRHVIIQVDVETVLN